MDIIVARNNNKGIGLNNTLPWRCSEDLKWFKEFTLGKTIVMGYNTFASLGYRELPNRRNIVLTSQNFNDVEVITSIDQIPDDAVVIGGAQLYKSILPKVDTMYISQINDNTVCDAHFDVDPSEWDISVHKILSSDCVVYKWTRRKSV